MLRKVKHPVSTLFRRDIYDGFIIYLCEASKKRGILYSLFIWKSNIYLVISIHKTSKLMFLHCHPFLLCCNCEFKCRNLSSRIKMWDNWGEYAIIYALQSLMDPLTCGPIIFSGWGLNCWLKQKGKRVKNFSLGMKNFKQRKSYCFWLMIFIFSLVKFKRTNGMDHCTLFLAEETGKFIG